MISPARCRGKCAKVTPHHLCWGGDGVYFTCTKCGEQFKAEDEPRHPPTESGEATKP